MTTYDFEGGSSGNAATISNTGAVSAPVASGGNVAQLSNATPGPVSGALSLEFAVGNTTQATYCEFAAEAGPPTNQSFYVAITLSADGYSVDTTLCQLFLTAVTTTLVRVLVTAAGALSIQDRGAAHTMVLSSDVTAKYGQTIVVRMQITGGTTTTNGAITARYYSSPSLAVGSPTNEVTATNLNLIAGSAWGNYRVGIITTQSSLGADGRRTRFDYLTMVSGLSWIASPAAATNPTANAGADQYGTSGTPFTLTGAGTIGTGGGSITAYAWSIAAHEAGAPTASLSAPAAATTNVTNLAPGVYTATLTVTQAGGLQASDTVVLWVCPPSGTSVTPFSVTKDTGITREGTAGTDVAALSDADVTTLLKWPDPPTSQKVTIRWNPCGPGSPVITLNGTKVGTGTVTRTVNHYYEDGTTLLDGPYTDTTFAGTMAVGLAPAAVTALGTTPANRRQLVTVITDLGS